MVMMMITMTNTVSCFPAHVLDERKKSTGSRRWVIEMFAGVVGEGKHA